MYYYFINIENLNDEYEEVRVIASRKKYQEDELNIIVQVEKRNAENIEEVLKILHEKYGFYIIKEQCEIDLCIEELGMEYYNTIQIREERETSQKEAEHKASLQRMEMSLRILEKYSKKPPENE